MRVVIADDSRMSRLVYENIINDSDRYELVGSFATAEEAVNFCARNPVDMVIMDIVMLKGDYNGIEAAGLIKQHCPETKVILMTSMPEHTFISKARENKVDSFWYKEIEEIPLLSLIDRTADGESIYPDSTPVLSLGQISSTEFTPRELEVLRLLVDGYENPEIAEMLCISPRTVKMHIENMLHRTGFRNRLELAVNVRADGFIIN
ncbi:MAG: response regulator transcription factor [Lachnospiraceae bacterium]|nr:response regulator transcription factor [Lachnospiraceae bacterium]MBR1675150.1 response regulator transcription factor [Eubacterium sp.]